MSVDFAQSVKNDFDAFKKDCIECLDPEYVKNFPTKVPRKAVLSFASAALTAEVCGFSRSSSFTLGSVAAVSTLIEAVTRPLIKNHLPKNTILASSCLNLLTFVPYRFLALLLTTTFVLNPTSPQEDLASGRVNTTLFGTLIYLKLFFANYGAYGKNEGFISV